MRIIYFDIDSLRADHLGCYGYHRATSPNIDQLAAAGVRFDQCHVSDAPCLPSRTSLFTGRFGIHSGLVNHGGVAAELRPEGPQRGFFSRLSTTSWMSCLRQAGLRTATVSSFGERHSAWHWYAGFNEVYNCGQGGLEVGNVVEKLTTDWLERQPDDADDWFLHVNLWDPHTPYNTPPEFGDPFADTPLPAWYTPEVHARHWVGCGPHSAREALGFDDQWPYAHPWPRQPHVINDMQDARRMFDGYDNGVLYADRVIGRILDQLEARGWRDDTWVVISADHGENLGELNVYCDHQTADSITSRVPLIICPPRSLGLGNGRVDPGLLYQNDMAATLVELAGGNVPADWTARSFAAALQSDRAAEAREDLVLSQMAWSCQRSVRWDQWLAIRSYHDGYHDFPDWMLFDVTADPHLQHNRAAERPDLVAAGALRLDRWMAEMLATGDHADDPMRIVMMEGGPFHTRGELPNYLERLRATGRSDCAERLAAAHPGDLVNRS